MPSIRVREKEPFDVAVRRFKRAVEKAGVITSARRRQFHEKPTTARKRAKLAAKKREVKRQAKDNLLFKTKGFRKPPSFKRKRVVTTNRYQQYNNNYGN
jgi:small subunit ribosomal protein S21